MAKKPDPKPTCISCGIGTLKVIGELPVTEYAGQLPDGTKYTSVHRTRMQCSNCQQVRIITEHK